MNKNDVNNKNHGGSKAYMGDHVNIIRNSKKAKVREHDESARQRRAIFKQHLRSIDEDFLEDEMYSEDADWFEADIEDVRT